MKLSAEGKIFIFIFIYAVFLAAGYIYFIAKIPLISIFSAKTEDALFSYRHSNAKPPDIINRIVIVDVDEETLSKLHQRWPINRGFYAAFLKKVYTGQSNPLAVGFDFIYNGESEQPQEDVYFAQALKETENVVIASYFDKDYKLILPEKIFTEAVKAVAVVNLPREYDLVIRYAYPFITFKDTTLKFSLPLEIFSIVKGFSPQQNLYDKKSKIFKLFLGNENNMRIPLDERGFMRINYFARLGDFKTVPLWKVLVSSGQDDTFKDKIVLVGSNSEMQHDIYPTPLGLLSGVCIHANILLSFLSERFPVGLPACFNFIIFLIIALSASVITYNLGNLKGGIFCLVSAAAGFYISNQLILRDIIFDLFGLCFIIVTSFISITAFKYLYVIIENVRLMKLAVTDGLTGLYVYRYFEAKLKSETNIALSEKKDLSIVIFDIDHFKKINDTYGHEAGNEVLRRVASLVLKRAHRNEPVSRFGGEEFVTILPNVDIDRAVKYAQAVRKEVENFSFYANLEKINVTVSAGAAELASLDKQTSEELFKSADKALYEAKSSGRNKVAANPHVRK